jgi:AcrR family transcriptional regulator
MDVTTITRKGARERILDAAGCLFSQQGFRAVGIDTIIAEAGVAKMTLYSHFPSKDDLIVAYLERSNAEMWKWLEETVAGLEAPKDKLIAIFKALGERADSPACLGCPIQATAAEFPDADHPGHKVALASKQEVRAYMLGLAGQAGLQAPEALSDQLMLLMDGAYAAARMYGPGNPARHVGNAASALIEAHAR